MEGSSKNLPMSGIRTHLKLCELALIHVTCTCTCTGVVSSVVNIHVIIYMHHHVSSILPGIEIHYPVHSYISPTHEVYVAVTYM